MTDDGWQELSGQWSVDAEDYRRLFTADERKALDEWMAETVEGWDDLRVWSVTIGEGYVDVCRWLTPPVYRTVTERFSCRRPPPVWKPLR